MLASLTGLGLASAAGLNAYVPLLVVGLVARYTDLVPLGPAWAWLEHPATLISLGVLLVVEFAADKVPALDSANDLLQTLVRPTSGGITFAAGTSAVGLTEITGEASGAAASTGGIAWGSVIAGTVIALLFHLAKALARPVINTLTLGAGAPVASFAEDVASFLASVIAVLLPLLVLIVFPLMVAAVVWAVRRSRRRRARSTAPRPGPGTVPGPGPRPGPHQARGRRGPW
ncbi:membrane protein [Nocardiopsis terrae]|uniref:Heme exporter protein D n=1 Tax=Nocardiopsis terrae TaxID=372655 RepID=A0ABR9HDY5_9ACTN|nr:DUF4126 domain-containing protein [Nocardiopsis terrae]MBE1457242.1 heme exporter protein D [Nocardiopsis terrae]GHC91334.1 membrane protein [Nocardiopsis terrae]